MGNTHYEVAIVGKEHATKRSEMAKHYIPNKILLGGKNEGSLDLLKGKLSKGNTFIYVCQNKSCQLPVKEVGRAIEQLKK